MLCHVSDASVIAAQEVPIVGLFVTCAHSAKTGITMKLVANLNIVSVAKKTILYFQDPVLNGSLKRSPVMLLIQNLTNKWNSSSP